MPGHYNKYVQKNKGVLKYLGMNMITKGIIGIIIVGAVGLGIFLYVTRPVDQSPVAIPGDTQATTTAPGATTESEKQLAVDNTQSKATFTLKEDLNGKRTTVIGETNAITGTVTINSATPATLSIGKVAIDARTFKTDNERRNGAIARMILESEKPEYTYITFDTTAVEGLPAMLEDGAHFPLIITGNLTIKKTTQPVTFTGTGNHTNGVLTANVSSVIKYKEFEVSVPQLPFLANVEEEVLAELSIVAK